MRQVKRICYRLHKATQRIDVYTASWAVLNKVYLTVMWGQKQSAMGYIRFIYSAAGADVLTGPGPGRVTSHLKARPSGDSIGINGPYIR